MIPTTAWDTTETGTERYRAVNRNNIGKAPQWSRLDPELREAIEVVSLVLPFRTNRYVMDHLIDWDRVPEDPMFQLTFSQREMLDPDQYRAMAELWRAGAPRGEVTEAANRIRLDLNPHPAGQLSHNVPEKGGCEVEGVQHKYDETVLFFPKRGQTCHVYCTYCFRWAQFVGLSDLRFAAAETDQLVAYLTAHPEVTDVLITGGDPMIMKTSVLAEYVEPLLEVDQLRSIRIGTKSPATWPARFVTDEDADDVLRLFEKVIGSGKHLALMAHYTHPVELSTEIAQEAMRRILSTGANVRMQAPVVRRVNDDATTWADLWREGVRLGAIPYYMFVERDTGPRDYFEIPLVRCWEIFRRAYRRVSGLARTVRGPSMSAFPGKVHILGVASVGAEKAFVLQYLQARDPAMVRRPFFARFDPQATWFDQLEPLTESDAEFFPTEQPDPAATLVEVSTA